MIAAIVIVKVWFAISIPCVIGGTWLHARRGVQSFNLRTLGVLMVLGPVSYLAHAVYLDIRDRRNG